MAFAWRAPAGHGTFRAWATFHELLEAGPDLPLLAIAHSAHERTEESHHAMWLEIPYPLHASPTGHRLEDEEALDVHVGEMHLLADSERAVELGEFDGHRRGAADSRHHGVEPGANSDRTGRDLLR